MAGVGVEQAKKTGASIEVDGQRVPLGAEGLERAQGEKGEVGRKLVEAVREAVGRATEGR
jgi:hypothetical protein